jgi:hypothetical protein
MIVFTFIDFVQRLPRLLISTTCLIIGMMAFLWYMGAKFAPRREWIYFPVSLLLGIASSTLLAALYCTLNPMASEFLLNKVPPVTDENRYRRSYIPLHILSLLRLERASSSRHYNLFIGCTFARLPARRNRSPSYGRSTLFLCWWACSATCRSLTSQLSGASTSSSGFMEVQLLGSF